MSSALAAKRPAVYRAAMLAVPPLRARPSSLQAWRAKSARAGRVPDSVRTEVSARSHGLCEARVPGCCTGRAAHLHHRLMRSQGGQHTAGNALDLCSACHSWIHHHPAVSYANGWLLRGHTR